MTRNHIPSGAGKYYYICSFKSYIILTYFKRFESSQRRLFDASMVKEMFFGC